MDDLNQKDYLNNLSQVRVSKDALETAYMNGFLESKLEEKFKVKVDVTLKSYQLGLSISLISRIVSTPENEVIQILEEHGIEVSK